MKLITCFYFFWTTLLFLTVSIIRIPNLPQRTHELASYLNLNGCINCDLGHLSNSLIASPGYLFLQNLFLNPKYKQYKRARLYSTKYQYSLDY